MNKAKREQPENEAKRQIQTMSLSQIEELSGRFESVSRGMLKKRQVMAYIMLKVKNVHVDDVADYMGIERSTVYSLSSKAREKFIGIQLTSEQMDRLDWFMLPKDYYE